jgi:cytochrome c biogenesis protein CcdA
MVALEGAFGYSFVAGVLAAVNPCGFVLLPTYLLYFLGIQSVHGATEQRATVRRALLVSAAVSAGFLLVFLVVGVVTKLFTSWIAQQSKYAGFGIGLALVVLGVAMLFGYRLPFTTPKLDAGGRDRTIRSMFVFGIAYAIASIGCTIGLFVSAVLGTVTRSGYLSGVIAVLLYGLGMALLVTALTVTLAVAEDGLLRFLRTGLRYVDPIMGVFVLLSGLYLTWYWWGAIQDSGSDSVTSTVEGWQADISSWLDQQGPARLGVVLGVIVVAAVAFAVWRRPRHGDRSK